MKSSWAESRIEWLDEEGNTKPPAWRGCGAIVQGLEDMEDATAHGEPGCKVQLQGWQGYEGLKEGVEEPYIVIDDVIEDVLGGIESA